MRKLIGIAFRNVINHASFSTRPGKDFDKCQCDKRANDKPDYKGAEEKHRNRRGDWKTLGKLGEKKERNRWGKSHAK